MGQTGRFARAALVAGVVAGVVSTFVQVLLWLLFTDAFPAILWRDARLTAALLMGEAVIAPGAGHLAAIMAVATLIHFVLSVIYAAAMGWLVPATTALGQGLAGALLGAALYALNLHGFVLVFPWFDVTRGGITLAAHVAFGVSAVMSFRRVAGRKFGN